MDRDALLLRMDAAAVAAGTEILRVRDGGISARTKSDLSPVTEADEAAERIILAALAAAAPSIPVIAEEQCAARGIPEAPERFFLVDPLDGTREFVDGRDHHTVNIALVEAGRATLAIVSAPALGRLWGGDVVAGDAWTRDLPGGPRRPVRARVPDASPVGLASRSVDSAETRDWFARAGVTQIDRIGSSLKLCLIAEGAADLYPRHGPTSEWDIAAGQAVLEAAGGRVLTASGAPLRYGKRGCANPPFVAAGAFDPPLP
ncbi:3'(2'), 5'-bisphosphate nucleotidase [Sphingomonas jejuensis]|uniref:3'(2'),5'-bisphosphate nucleotidase CysQ n=1 Tax=Sphingomonas jejuensis TaxID=904715 RepID=A0ABX0XLU2_9SPHN|nr:3'(2'),5'-bisphosphate nucleotidase CysQ [Sphingomonas jejuensis]NJC34204.1 3'(2'), 5'-bisphosphate nucleotidase [Sphingomonas jejuensis]